MHRYSKRMKHQLSVTANQSALPAVEAVRLLQSLEGGMPEKLGRCKFDQTVSLCVSLGIDPRQADQIVRGSIVLPHGIGKSQRVIAFAQGANAEAALAAGADVVGGRELAERVKGGWLDFDVAIAATDMMGVVGPLGKILGPRGLMPSPKAGTVTQNVAAVVKEYKAGKVEFRCDTGGNVHCVIGKLSFSEQMLTENFQALLQYLRSLKPSTSKGQYFKRVGVVGTMTPCITVSI
jgi:large subunit ribosomal protein L1